MKVEWARIEDIHHEKAEANKLVNRARKPGPKRKHNPVCYKKLRKNLQRKEISDTNKYVDCLRTRAWNEKGPLVL